MNRIPMLVCLNSLTLLRHGSYDALLIVQYNEIYMEERFNQLQPVVAFLYPLKTCSQGVQKSNNGP